jgi:NTE family protein
MSTNNTQVETMKRKIIIAALITIFAGYLTACAGFSPNIQVPQKAPPPAPIKKQPQVAIVLGGGGAKGFAHIGVLEVLQKAGVPIDIVSGASAGSVVAALYADNGNADEAKDALMNAGFWDVADIGNFPSLKGPIKGYRLEKFLLKHMRSHDFKQTKIPLIVATTDLKKGVLYPIHSGPIAPAVLASGAMPGAVRPPHLYGHILVDGCMVDPVPVNLVKRYHPKIIIAINIDSMLPKDMPWSFYGIYNRGFQISWLALTRYTEKDANVLIRPQVGTVGTFDWSAKQKMYEAGVAAGKKALPQILKLLKEKGIPLKHLQK